MASPHPLLLLPATLGLLLIACDGDYGGGREAGLPAPGESPEDCQSLFSERVQPRLDFCRSCHVPDGVADVPDGEAFQLRENPDEDFERLYAAWERLGRNQDGVSLLLRMAAGTAGRSHSGGAPWPPGSAAYEEVNALLQGFEDPAACGGQGGSPEPSPEALLGSARGGHLWARHCAGAPDETRLPTDPRTLIQPGSQAGRAVVFNVDWRDCHLSAAQRPGNCGEYRALLARGELVGRGQGQIGSPHMFSGDAWRGIDFEDPGSLSAEASPYTLSAAQYNRLWQVWDGYLAGPALPQRPENFDQLVAERYGSPLPPQRNPYPLPGEDPNQSAGGSGQLPLAFTQLRDPADGAWTGMIGVKLCSFCHDGHLGGDGPGVVYGGAGSIGDFTVAFRDFAAVGALAFGSVSGTAVTIASNRGSGAIDQFQIGFVAFNGGSFEELSNDKIVFSQAIGNIKSPPWWNLGHRPQKFHGAVLPTDSARIDLAAYYPLFAGFSGGDPVAWLDTMAYPFQLWAEALESPVYPGPVDEALARQGAILFHAKNLWAAELNNPVPPPAQPGNGSCASCHGAYSPRFVQDSAYLADPRFEGIAANLVPMAVIGTDPNYAEAMQSLRNADGSPNVAIDHNPMLACGIGSFADTPNREAVMLAPPLYGIWASAPYLHNGALPNLWGVLDPDTERPAIWRRVSRPAPAGLAGRVVMGFDTSLKRAYDHQRLGWHYEVLDCLEDAPSSQPALACHPLPLTGSEERSPLQLVLDELYHELALSWNLPADELFVTPLSDTQIENRKIYNTHLYAQGNQGHAFTAVLNDAERRALIEYLKTL